MADIVDLVEIITVVTTASAFFGFARSRAR